MNTKQLFFFSLIILSVAMGLNWYKNRPAKPVQKEANTKTRQAVSLSDKDFQLKDNPDEGEEENEKEEEEEETENQGNKKYEGEVSEEEEENEDENNTQPGTENASDTVEVTASETIAIENPLKDDPVMKEYFQMVRNPFETSPYAQLVEKLRIEAELAARPVEEKKEEVLVPKLMSNAKFNGTIETERGPKVIVDGNIYEKGNELNGCIIKEIKPNLIVLTSGEDKWLLPKTGVNVQINPETGEYSVDDSFE